MRFWQASVTLLAAVSLAAPAAAKGKSNPAAVALFRKAIQSSEIKGKNGTPFRLQATVQIFTTTGISGGMVVEFWAPGEARRETFVTGYSQVEVLENKKAWAKDSSPYTPFPIVTIWDGLSPARKLKSMLQPRAVTPIATPRTQEPQEQTTLGKPKRDKGSNEECVEARTRGVKQKRRYCFDGATGYLDSVTDEYLRFQYSDYHAFGAKVFPRTIRVFYGDGRPFIDLRVVRMDPEPNPTPSTFQPPPGSQEQWTTACGTGTPQVKRAKLLKQALPIYPSKAKKDRVEGTVRIYLIIGEDGAPHAMWLLSSPSPLLTTAAWNAVQQWRYQPTMVCGQKVDVDTIVTIRFNWGRE